jgi:hypothetical protein
MINNRGSRKPVEERVGKFRLTINYYFMKKYLLGIVAITLAIGFASFTKPVVKKTKFTTYWFQASNTRTLPNCSTVALTFPGSVPPTSVSSCSGSTNICWLSFPGYKLVGSTYRPSTAAGGGTEITDSCTYSADVSNP